MTAILTKILTDIKNPSDVKKLNLEDKKTLASEIREAILNRVNKIGGHIGPDLGIVEATIAMHTVFNSPVDKFVFDVSHQCYPHKMLTGRQEGLDRKSTRLNSSHQIISYAVFCLKKKK